MSGSVENMVQDMLKDELGLSVIQNYNQNAPPASDISADSNFIPVDNSTLNNTNISDENNHVEKPVFPPETETTNDHLNTELSKIKGDTTGTGCEEVEKAVENTSEGEIDKEKRDESKTLNPEAEGENLDSIIKDLMESDVKLKEMLGEENKIFEEPFTEMEMTKLMKQKLKRIKIEPDRLKQLLNKTLEDSDYRKLVRLKWRVRGLAYKIQIMDGSFKKALNNVDKKTNKEIGSGKQTRENYNENRRRKMETDAQYRKRVRDANAESRKRRMEDPDYRTTLRTKYNEARRRRKQREGEDYVKSLRERDNLLRRRRKIHVDEERKAELRAKENERRRQRRQNQEYREFEKLKERASRRKKMENEEYRAWCRERDNMSRRRRRQDPAYRKLECQRDTRVSKMQKQINTSANLETPSNSNETLVCIDEDPDVNEFREKTIEKQDNASKNNNKAKDKLNITSKREENTNEDEQRVGENQIREDKTIQTTTLEEEFTEIIQPPTL